MFNATLRFVALVEGVLFYSLLCQSEDCWQSWWKNTFLLNVDWKLIVPFFCDPNVLRKHRYPYILTSECRYVFPARLSIHPLRRFSSHASQCIYYSTHAIVLKSSLPACSERDVMFREVFLSSTFCLVNTEFPFHSLIFCLEKENHL